MRNRPGRPWALRADHLVAPLGLGARAPRLSWKLPPGSDRQHAYRIVATGWDSGRVGSAESLFVPCGVAPVSGLAVEWKVQVWTGDGGSAWSAPSTYEHGLIAPADWSARWIGPVEDGGAPERRRPAYALAGVFAIGAPAQRARLYVSAHGLYEIFVNGGRAGDAELTPGFTSYRNRLAVQVYDVSGLLVPGENVLGALVSDGWWRGQTGVARRVDDYGTTTALLAQLVVTFEDGTSATFGTGDSWRSCASHVLAADLIAGEVHDLRRRTDWRSLDGWGAVRIEDHGYDALCASPAPPVRRVEELRPVSIRSAGPGRSVVDAGQNLNGWIRLGGLGPEGTRITLTYGEWLDAAGDVTQEHLADPTSVGGGGRPRSGGAASVPFQSDTVISAGREGDVFEPRHSTKGFRYVAVDGYDGAPSVDHVRAVVVHTDLERRGSFECSDDRINAIHRMAEWSFRSNACDIPTDCPTRERSGWTGDWQAFVESAAFLYDIGGFSVKWLADLAADQRPDGKVTNLVPEPHPGDDRPPPFWPHIEGSAGWGDAAVHVPWVVYRCTADARVLEDQWASMCAWVDFAARSAAGGRHPSRVARSAEPMAHERFVWDTGWHFGEWLEPGESLADAIRVAASADHGAVATAYLHRSAAELAGIARVLGREADARRYGELAGCAADAWRTEFLAEDGTVTPGTQANYARAIAFGLVPEHVRARCASRLVELVRRAGLHPGTGFLATALLLPVLAETGHADVAYELLSTSGEPSWCTMLDRGATTVWEEWGGVDADGVPHASLNHYGKGAVITFLHRDVAGLQLVEPGYRRWRFAPHPGGGLDWAAARHESPYGPIGVRWESRGDGGRLDVELDVPPGTTAELALPGRPVRELGPGRHAASA